MTSLSRGANRKSQKLFSFVKLEEKPGGVPSTSESELFTGDTSKDNHLPGPVIRGICP